MKHPDQILLELPLFAPRLIFLELPQVRTVTGLDTPSHIGAVLAHRAAAERVELELRAFVQQYKALAQKWVDEEKLCAERWSTFLIRMEHPE